VRQRVVGRDRELRLLLAALGAGRDLLLEGPPGTSKSTLLHEVTAAFGVPLVFVEGNAELSTAKLVGHHNPARVLQPDFSAASFHCRLARNLWTPARRSASPSTSTSCVAGASAPDDLRREAPGKRPAVTVNGSKGGFLMFRRIWVSLAALAIDRVGTPNASGQTASPAHVYVLVRNPSAQSRLVKLQASGLPQHWLLSFCYGTVCNPFKVSFQLAAGGSKQIELLVAPLAATGGRWSMSVSTAGQPTAHVRVSAPKAHATITVSAT